MMMTMMMMISYYCLCMHVFGIMSRYICKSKSLGIHVYVSIYIYIYIYIYICVYVYKCVLIHTDVYVYCV